MTAKTFLRIGAGLMLLHTVGHTMGAMTWQEAPNAAIAKVISGMQTEHFEFMGKQASLGSFFQGYGIINIFMLLFITVLLWLLGSDAENPLTMKLLPFLILFLVLMAVGEYIYFFPFAAIITALAAICALVACLRVKKSERA